MFITKKPGHSSNDFKPPDPIIIVGMKAHAYVVEWERPKSPTPATVQMLGFHKLKSVITQVELFELILDTTKEVYVDPVCHMHIDPTKASPTADLAGVTYHFCSEYCKSLFLANPQEFAGDGGQ